MNGENDDRKIKNETGAAMKAILAAICVVSICACSRSPESASAATPTVAETSPMPTALLSAKVISADVDKVALGKLVAHIGSAFWSAPEKRLVRATTYKKGKTGSDSDSKNSKGNEKIGLRYATAKEAGTLSVPDWLPRGSMVKIYTEHGVYAYIAADEGRNVDRREAAKESGKTEEQKAASVLDFCAEKQLWPDFIIVEIYYYAGKVPFNELSLEEQKALFAYAMEYVSKRE